MNPPRIIRLRSRRAPYVRAGIRFSSIRVAVEISEDQLTADQLDKLNRDPAISIEIADAPAGEAGDSSSGAAPAATTATTAPTRKGGRATAKVKSS